ncbi:MAG: NUDIX domain-containing protein [Sedimentisphaerales bacterium]|nr:NUDIX domain-containing protein [Sedimentisphaerales bacterium]
MNILQEIPIKSFSIAAYICRIENGIGRYLIIKRQTPYLNDTWQMVSGALEKGETAWEAALREIEEETGLVPDRLYSINDVELFYEINQNCINIIPVFVGFLDTEQSVRLSHEHSEYKWVSAEEAVAFFSFDNQMKTIRRIEKQFVQRKPFEFLRVNIPDVKQ